VTAVALTFISSVASNDEESVLNAVQLLWVNLIMDTFAALALATDPPAPSVLDRRPDKKTAGLISTTMGKMIIGQAICQLAITLVLNFGGATLLGYDIHNPSALIADHEHRRLSTLIFNTFVWLQIFNEVNNRRLDNRLNIFEGISRNYFFIIINLIMIGGQELIIFFGGEAFKITPLNGKEWGLSIGLGAISIPWGALIRMFPDAWAEKLVPPVPNIWPFNRKKSKHPEDGLISDETGAAAPEDLERPYVKPLRTMTSIRAPSATSAGT
jgi:Ca2+-transporting ATPase